jgi:ribosome maturation factor RimP
MREEPYKLRHILEPVIAAMGYELVGVEFHPGGANALLRIYIDKASGIGVDDCQRVSNQVSGVLDVEDPIPGHYTLEVSSPGLDRPLFDAEHFVRFAGHRVRMELNVPLDGRRKIAGLLKGMFDGEVAVEVDGVERRVPLERIGKARLIPEL